MSEPSELNLMEQFWSVVESKIREKDFLKKKKKKKKKKKRDCELKDR
jgi:hypothetical protein